MKNKQKKNKAKQYNVKQYNTVIIEKEALLRNI